MGEWERGRRRLRVGGSATASAGDSQSLVREGERRGVCERRRESEAGREEWKIIMQWKIMNRDIP